MYDHAKWVRVQAFMAANPDLQDLLKKVEGLKEQNSPHFKWCVEILFVMPDQCHTENAVLSFLVAFTVLAKQIFSEII